MLFICVEKQACLFHYTNECLENHSAIAKLGVLGKLFEGIVTKSLKKKNVISSTYQFQQGFLKGRLSVIIFLNIRPLAFLYNS